MSNVSHILSHTSHTVTPAGSSYVKRQNDVFITIIDRSDPPSDGEEGLFPLPLLPAPPPLLWQRGNVIF